MIQQENVRKNRACRCALPRVQPGQHHVDLGGEAYVIGIKRLVTMAQSPGGAAGPVAVVFQIFAGGPEKDVRLSLDDFLDYEDAVRAFHEGFPINDPLDGKATPGREIVKILLGQGIAELHRS